MLVEVVTDNVQAVFALRYPLDRVPDEWEIPEVEDGTPVRRYGGIGPVHSC